MSLTSRRAAGVAVLLLAGGLSAEGGRRAVADAGGAPDTLSVSAMSATECGRCHDEPLAEHLRSGHARSFTSPLFQREWEARGFEGWCVPCHAPRTEAPLAEPALARAGVDCVSCHVRDGAVLATHVTGRAPHRSSADAALAEVGACAGCHQADAPPGPGVAPQDTVAEWRAAGARTSCQSCHVPERDGRHGHELPGGHDPALLSRALVVDATAEREGWDTRVRLRLEAAHTGHAVPTGDVFRTLVVRAWDPAYPLEARSVELGRRLGASGPRADDRVPPPGVGAREVTIRLSSRAQEVQWEIELWSLPPLRAERLEIPAASIRRTMASGTIEDIGRAPRSERAARR